MNGILSGGLNKLFASGAVGALGAGLLSGRTMGQGLGLGFQGANAALQGFQQQQQAKAQYQGLLSGATGLTPQQRAVLGAMDPAQGIGILSGQAFPKFNKDQALLKALNNPDTPLGRAAWVEFGLEADADTRVTQGGLNARHRTASASALLGSQDKAKDRAQKGEQFTIKQAQEMREFSATHGLDLRKLALRAQEVGHSQAMDEARFGLDEKKFDRGVVEFNADHRLNRDKFDRGIVENDRDFTQGVTEFNNPQAPSLIRELQAAGIDPASPEGRKRILEGTSKGTTINVGAPSLNVAPGAFDPSASRDAEKLGETLSKVDANFMNGLREQASSAGDLESYATQLEALAPDLGYTGPGGGFYGAVDDAIGILPGDKGTRGAFRSLSMDARLTFTEKTKGAITDREMADFARAVPSLNQTRDGNMMIAQVLRAGAKRKQMQAAFFDEYLASNGGLTGAQMAWGQYMREHPLIKRGKDGEISLGAEGDLTRYLSPKSVSEPIDYTSKYGLE